MTTIINKDLLVSIIIPSYNEEQDIAGTLESVINLRYPNKEIIVVDDSTDNTPNIIKKYEEYGIKILRQKINKGLNGAYNLGIMEAKGEIVVLLTADNRPEPDFIDKIIKHYQEGADFVLVESRIANNDRVFARLLDAQHIYKYSSRPKFVPLWSEGFSCKKEAAMDVGMFPVDFPISGGTDNYFSEKLHHKYRKVFDKSIVMYHVAPSRFKDFWKQQFWRGKAGPQFNFFIKKEPILKIFLKISIKNSFYLVKTLLIIPLLYESFRLTKFSHKKINDWLPFWYALTISHIARTVGEIAGFIDILKNFKK